jgi:hypothetical protein
MDQHTAPFVVSVIGSESFKPAAKERAYRSHLCWANKAPKNMIKALEGHDVGALKAAYGYDPLEEMSPPKRKIIGGDDTTDEFSMESLIEGLESTDKDNSHAAPQRMYGSRFVASRQVKFDKKINVIKDIWMLPEDNMLTLKKKIQLASGIPTYRQHLWYESQDSIVSPCYSFFIGERRIAISLWDLVAVKSFVLALPVNTDMYVARDRIRVRNSEFSTVLKNMPSDARWYVTDLNDFIGTGRENMSATIRSDIHVRELIYYSFIIKYWPAITNSVFQIFVTNELVLHEEYPEMSFSDSLIKCQLTLETSIVSENPSPSVKKWPLRVYIEESIIAVINEYYSYGTMVNLRNLFDTFKLSSATPYMICRMMIGGRLHTLVKTYKGGRTPMNKLRINIDTLCIMVYLPNVGEMFITISASGTYQVRTKWREDMYINIDQVTERTIEYANPVIAKINSLGEAVVVRDLVGLNEHNMYIIDTVLVLVIQRKMSLSEFETLKTNAGKMKQAGMINITSQETNLIALHVLKGMYSYDDARFDAISNTLNGYEYATAITVRQRWEAIYQRQKSTTISNRSMDIYIKGSGIKQGEYSDFIKYMLMLVQMSSSSSSATTPAGEKKTRTIMHLKESDPLLYDLKKIYKHKVMYSQICQKPNQPILVDGPTKKSVTFWNFTRREPAYYECPSAKFPVLYFKTGVHPANFCVPCCKKTDLNPGSKHEAIFERCIKDHVYTSESKNVTMSTYIVAYTHELEPGRLSYLPEASLDQLFYQQYSVENKPVDLECIPKLGYYVYGVRQTVGQLRNVGLISCLAHAMGMDFSKFILDTANKIAQQPELWHLLLEGQLFNHFKSADDFAAALGHVATTMEEVANFDRWNEVFINIARLYWGVNVILFIDQGNGQVSIRIPAAVKHVDELISRQHKHLFVITTDSRYLPIYLVNITEFKKSNTLTQTIFAHGDKIIEIVRKMMLSIISDQLNGSALDLEEVIKFADASAPEYTLECALINRQNICYAVMLAHRASGYSIFFPVTSSLHDHLSIARRNEEFSTSGYNVPATEVLGLINAFNSWSAKEKDDQDPRAIALWILFGEQVIGFQDQYRQYIYYVKPLARDDALAIKQAPMMRVQYDPTAINALINKTSPVTIATAAPTGDVAQCLYDHYKYQLFVLEFMASINSQTNAHMREKIASLVEKRIKTPTLLFHDLKGLLVDWPTDYDCMVNIFSKFARMNGSEASEYSALIGHKKMIYNAASINRVIDQSRFAFDDTVLASMFILDKTSLEARLDDILKPLIEISSESIKVESFPEMITSCHGNDSRDGYCSTAGKLRVSEHDYAIFREQLAIDIKNPLKQDKLMMLITKSTTNELSFIGRADESIVIYPG